jgi:hypothetical protein
MTFVYPKKSIVFDKSCQHVATIINNKLYICDECGCMECSICGTHYLTEEFLIDEYYKKIFPEEF